MDFTQIAKAFPVVAVAGVATLWAPRLSWRWRDLEKKGDKPVPSTSGTTADFSPQGRGTVRVLCQNVWNSFFAGGPERLERLQALREFVDKHDVDILVTQEMFCFALGPLADTSEARSFSKWMFQLGLVHQTSPFASLPWFGQNSGLVVYSRFPILEHSHGTFIQRRAVSAKGWLQVTFNLKPGSSSLGDNQRQLTLFNTHLEHAHTAQWQAVRKSQWMEIVDRARQLRMNGADHIAVLGDFNICEHANWQQHAGGGSEYEELHCAMSVAGLPKDLFGGGPHTPSMRAAPEEPTFAPDHCFVTRSLGERVVRTQMVDSRGDSGLAVSDHLGLMVDISL